MSMKIETKFSKGDEVWYIDGGPSKFKIDKIIAIVEKNGDVSIEYSGSNVMEPIDEDSLFSSKQELLLSFLDGKSEINKLIDVAMNKLDIDNR